MNSENLKVEQKRSVYEITDGVSIAVVTIDHISGIYWVWRQSIKSDKFLKYCNNWAEEKLRLIHNPNYCDCMNQWPRETTDGYYCINCEKKIK